ncbi:phenylacetate--CoA ligase family protein [Methanoculleus sp. FWC-SCC1]|uniref:Phenylacetate--CoA ligase family protein n=1 Tax=Methanoculleus frigidifontis TaxID=2584085 RepID=A0ABT8ME08_9EURY|nr:phenylacetate--CoA ligase family protein [Methanoculleus sp. FWC-SCC1]MDN7026090.1 phenylacetate--CoA ligase family protein [Methanoculleus sp. FWC-SCC1]
MNRIWERMYNHESVTAKALGMLPVLRTFRDTYALLQRSQRWSREELEAYQRAELARLLEHAYEHVPYYRRVFDERSLNPADIHDFADLRLLPFLTKEIVQNNLADLRATSFPEDAFEYVTTGGSTGIPVGFYYEKGVSRAKEWAFMKAQWDRVGYRFIDKCVVLRGNVVPSAEEGIFWKKTLFRRWLIMSSYHMTEENMPAYIRQIRKFTPKYIQAYPSIIIILAKYMERHGIEPFPSLKAVLCGSENLYPWQRELIEEVFGCRVYSWYGNSEQTVLAGECEMSSCYHIFPEYGIVELLGKDDQPVMEPGQMGEVVATSLTNYICPLIRYRTMDLATRAALPCPCGRAYPLLEKVEGRLQEFIVTKNDRMIPMTAVNMHSAVFDNVMQFQFFQEREGEVILKIVRKSSYTDSDTESIRRESQKKLGEDVRVTIHFVESIPRTERGKYRFLIQRLPIENCDL